MRQSLADRKHELDTLVEGWAVPVFKRTDPFTGDVLNGLGRADFERIVAGYGCPECLALFRTYMARCPGCGHERNVARDVQDAPAEWTQHLEDRASGYSPPIARPRNRVRFSIDDVLEEIANDPDVEQIPMSKLKPKRRPKER